MKTNRGDFLKVVGMAGVGVVSSSKLSKLASCNDSKQAVPVVDDPIDPTKQSIIGLYGPWANSLNDNKIPSYSLRNIKWQNIDQWKVSANERILDRLGIPDIGGLPKVTVKKQYQYNGLHIEELSWQLPYGRATEAILLKPADAKGPLPGILAFHDHGANKYFGTRKITRTSDKQHPDMVEHQEKYYCGMAWANEIAKRGYVVLVSDAFPFASRRVMMEDIPLRVFPRISWKNSKTSKNQPFWFKPQLQVGAFLFHSSQRDFLDGLFH